MISRYFDSLDILAIEIYQQSGYIDNFLLSEYHEYKTNAYHLKWEGRATKMNKQSRIKWPIQSKVTDPE